MPSRTRSVAAWDRILAAYAACFTRPSYVLFCELVTAWILCPGRRTVTRMIGLLEPRTRRAHDAYHRFLRRGAWRMSDLWPILARGLVAAFASVGILPLDLDDTLFHKTGRRIVTCHSLRTFFRGLESHCLCDGIHYTLSCVAQSVPRTAT